MAAKLPVAMGLPKLPDPTLVDFGKPEETKNYMINLASSLGQHLMRRPAVSTPQASRLWLSPNGTAYKMTVSDDGEPVFEQAQKRPG